MTNLKKALNEIQAVNNISINEKEFDSFTSIDLEGTEFSIERIRVILSSYEVRYFTNNSELYPTKLSFTILN